LSSSDRAAELRELLNGASIAYYVDDVPVMDDVAYDTLYDELKALEAADPVAHYARLADAARRGAALRKVPEGAPPHTDGLAREGDHRRGAAEVGGRHAEAARER